MEQCKTKNYPERVTAGVLMSQSLSRVYVHITFSTKDRKKLIDKNLESRLHEYIGGICKGFECYPIIVGGFSDHIHILCILSKNISQVKLLEELKKQTSKWVKNQGTQYNDFYWQAGYGIFSVNPSEIDVVEKYIMSQHEHHAKKSFKDEYRAFLKKYQVEYDESYVWD